MAENIKTGLELNMIEILHNPENNELFLHLHQ